MTTTQATTSGAAISRVLGHGGFYTAQTGFDRYGIFCSGCDVGHAFVDISYQDPAQTASVARRVTDYLTGKGYTVTANSRNAAMLVVRR